jgi:cytochrome P450
MPIHLPRRYCIDIQVSAWHLPAHGIRLPGLQDANWTGVVVPRPDGRLYVTAFYQCCHCSAMFTDPEKFSVGRDDAAKKSLAERMERKT